MADGLKENDQFPLPIITPSTKADNGEHDEDISREDILAKGIVSEEDYLVLEKYTKALFQRGSEIARKRGLILVDTKYEFGKTKEGKIVLIDEIHTPDSSRYFYDEDISREDILAKGIVSEEDYLVLEKYTKALFQRGSEIARKRGLILVDTKYEFGKTKEGKIVLIDEIHTPDSSRYFYDEGYQERQDKGIPQKQLSKEFVRQWLIENGFQGLDGQQIPAMSDDKIIEISNRYIELYEQITGEAFEKAATQNVLERIEEKVTSFLVSN